MKNEIRQAVSLSRELENQIFEIQDQATDLREEGKNEEAEIKIKEALDLMSESKFNSSCSHIILCDLIELLNINKKHNESKFILEGWIQDLETSGYKIYETTPYILLGETYLYLNEIDNAKEQFYNSVKYGATKRDFSAKPNFYFDIAKKKITDNTEIRNLFDSSINDKPNHKVPKELSDAVCEQIEELSEKGNEHFDNEQFGEAIKIWKQALSLIPTPQSSYSESLWLETSIGDSFFLLEEYQTALEHFQNAKSNIEEKAYENPFIMLRIGQNLLKNNQSEEAKEYLLRAYMMEGEPIFAEDDEIYFNFLKQNVQL